MQIGIICPVKDLDRYAVKSNFHLILPHLYQEFPEYKEFYAERVKAGDFVLQDNSVFELGYSLDADELITLANSINASEMSVCEVLNSSEANYRAVLRTIERSVILGNKIPLLAVTQGETIESFLNQFFALNDIAEISTLGIPFDVEHLFANTNFFSHSLKSQTLRRVVARWELVKLLNYVAETKGKTIKPTHLMGLADGVELQMYKNIPWIRSNDSSSAYVHGAAGILYTDKGLPCEKIPTKLDFSSCVKTQTQHEAILYNISKLQEFANVSAQ